MTASPGSSERWEVGAVEKLLLQRIAPLPPETVAATVAGRRVLAEPVSSSIDVPRFDRASLDGYAVRSEDTDGAAEFTPVSMSVVGDSYPGNGYAGTLGRCQAVRITTGAPLPAGADSILVSSEATSQGDSILAIAAVRPGRGVSRAGEDVKAGEVLLAPGRLLRPQDVGLLASIGVGRISVTRRPRVDIIVIGSELLPAGRKPEGARVVDSNGPMLAALAERDGAIVQDHPIVRDDPDALKERIQKASGDVILLSGGSTTGVEDHAPRVVKQLGELVVHGMALKPAPRAGIGFIGTRPVFLLPGNPLASLCAYDFFAGPSIRALGGRSREWPGRIAKVPLAQKIQAEAGGVDYVRVRIESGKVVPVPGGSSLSTATKADGFVVLPGDAGAIPEGTAVTVRLYG